MWFPESAVDSTAFSNQIHVPVLVRDTFAGRRNVRKACKISDTLYNLFLSLFRANVLRTTRMSKAESGE